MSAPSYRLELLPVDDAAAAFYKNIVRSPEDAGVDLCAVNDYVLEQGQQSILKLGVRARLVEIREMFVEDPTVKSDAKTPIPVCMEESVHYWLAPRSSIFKSGVIMANSMGVIDKGYRGELGGPVWAMRPTTIAAGTRLFQIVAPNMGSIQEVLIVDALPESIRGEGGFGSTG